MNGMNQDDILRELELLPVWQSRAPVIKAPDEVTEAAPTAEATAPLPITDVVAPEPALNVVEQQAEQNPEPEVISERAAPAAASSTDTFRCVISEDAQWLFVLQQQHGDEAETLLQNMIKAVSVKVGQSIDEADVAAVRQHASKVIVVMGEEAAQQLLDVTAPLVALRGKTHAFNDTPVITTYSPEALLLNLTDKSKAWEDLCLAKFTIANLSLPE